jgi:hypothetical protein
MAEEREQKNVHRRRVTLNDGRYLIFYTFEEQLNSGREVEGAGQSAGQSEPDAEPQAEEERRV